ncbi:hypothetical protein Patl1_27802 [Pistacia atlantica]|uniref:Uncharacterized protein n=1 Tax=Pistacia atlantica TaxID=434234 RepID=A0ACC1BE60_9ROSI|nr:hypothetical protein Patl1_27802 [Pistacia atlantica]
MGSVLVMCLLLFLLFLHTQAQLEKITLGSSLSPKTNHSSWHSPSGHFAFGFYQQGNGFAVGIWLVDKPNITVVWTANRDDPPVPLNSTIKFTKDGGLLLRTAQGDEKAIVKLFEQPASASMLDSGNFIIYGHESQIIWQSFDNPTDTILGGQRMKYSQLISSRSTSDHSSGQFYLNLHNYELAAYPVNHSGIGEECYWNVRILVTGYPLQLNLSLSGTLQLTDGNNILQAIANSSYSATSKTVIYRATLDADGILRLYSHRFDINGNSNVTIEWSALINQCEVKGFCGFNSFCSSDSNKTDCYCFPGFDFIDPQEKFQGCNRNFTDEEGCQRKEPALVYNITNLEKTKLGGLAYEKQRMHKEDCSESCLNDCHCGGALYSDGTCNKFKLPLMFGMKDENESHTVFIKWNSGNPNLEIPPFLHKRVDLSENKKNLIITLAVSLGFIMFLCLLVAISSFLVYKLRVNRYKKLPGNSCLGLTQEFTLQSFSYSELEQATDGFKEKLGRGWLGAIYKGSIYEGSKMIAVKRLENPPEEAERKFRAEMVAVRQTHHRNLVRLLGFCLESSRKLLVYEYMSKGPLADLLLVALEEVHMKTLERMVKVGLLCIQDEPNLRPSMKNAILMLEGTMDIPVPPCPSPLVST